MTNKTCSPGKTISVDGGLGTSQPYHILLLLPDNEDRRLLVEFLEQRFTVTTASDTQHLDEPFDLCLLDEETFGRHADAVIERKALDEPVFLPYLLLLDDYTPASIDPRIWEHVDELVDVPVNKSELQGRITSLLVRRDLSKALAQREDRIRQILQTIPDPLLIVDHAGTVMDTNQAFTEYTGTDPDAVVTSNITEIVALPSETIDTLARLAARVHDSPPPWGREVGDDTDDDSIGISTISYRSDDGTIRYAEVGVAALSRPQSTRPETLFILRDVTDRISREKALEHERDRLNDFAHMLAHEVRNPLNIAQGYLQEITPNDDSEHSAFERIVSAHKRMDQMIKELLAHARGSVMRDVQTVSLGEIATVAWGQTPTADATLELLTDEMTVEADPENFQTILENLFRNAMQHAGPTVTVRVGALDDGGFYIEDNGPGIPPNNREQVFERGFTTNSAGTGLGLALVRQVAEGHGWVVRATESSEGGARFEFRPTDDEPDILAETSDLGSSGDE